MSTYSRNGDRELPVRFLALFGVKGIFSQRFMTAPISFKLVTLLPFLATVAFVAISWLWGPAIMIPFIFSMKALGLINEVFNFWVPSVGYGNITWVAKYVASPLFFVAGWTWLYFSFRKLMHLESFRDLDHYDSFDNVISSLTTAGMPLPMVTFSLVLAGLIMVGSIGFTPTVNPADRATHAKIDSKMYKSLEMKKGSDVIKKEFDYVLEGVRNTAEVMKLSVAFALETGFLPFVAFLLFLYALAEFVNHMAKEYDLWARYRGREALEKLTGGESGTLEPIHIDNFDMAIEVVKDSVKALNLRLTSQQEANVVLAQQLSVMGQTIASAIALTPLTGRESPEQLSQMANEKRSHGSDSQGA